MEEVETIISSDTGVHDLFLQLCDMDEETFEATWQFHQAMTEAFILFWLFDAEGTVH